MPDVRIIHGDSREVLRTLDAESIAAVVCDPPYALVSIVKRFGKPGSAPAKGNDAYMRASAGFMNAQWDTGETAFDPAFWAEVWRVLKPGAHIVAFAGTRTYHRLAVAIEDGGFEIRDMIAWLYGSGFPKSHDVAKAVDKAAGVEFSASPASGVGFMGPDGPGGYNVTKNQLARVGESTPDAQAWEGWGTALKPALEPIVLARKPLIGTVVANVLEHGTGALNIDGCRVGTEGGTRKDRSDDKSTTSSVGSYLIKVAGTPIDAGRWPANVVHDGSDEVVEAFPDTGESRVAEITSNPGAIYGGGAGIPSHTGVYGFNGSGSAARFFYSAKADATDRMGSGHPTVKPVDLMAWLCRLITPPSGVILDPFAGSGTTGLAALREGFDCVLIEREAEYVADIERRFAWARGDGGLTRQVKARRKKPRGELPLALFDDEGEAPPAAAPLAQSV